MPPLYIEENGRLIGFTEHFAIRVFQMGYKIQNVRRGFIYNAFYEIVPRVPPVDNSD
jgi:hypothetical protein